MDDKAVVVEGLRKRFGDVVALDGIDFEVARGTVFGLLGPNGAGKTTAVRVLATVLRPDAGRAQVLGHDVVRDAAVDPNLTGRENLRMVGILGQMPRADVMPRAAELLKRFDLSSAADRPLRTYSGGMRRRLDIAASLMPRPPVLFLDEPTTGLDLPSRNELWEMIRELVSDGTTVLLTTQYLEEADRLATRIAVVDDGKVIANDTPERLKSNLGNTIVELGLRGDGRAERALALLRESLGDRVEREGVTIRITSDQGARVLFEVLRTLDRDDLEPDTLTVREPSIDDVFLALTGHRAESQDGRSADDSATKRGAA